MVTPGWGLRGVRERNDSTGLGQTHSPEPLDKKVPPLLSGPFQAWAIPGGLVQRRGKSPAKSKARWFPGR